MSLPPLGYPFINEEFEALSVAPADLDRLLAEGWRHFGTKFFRYSLAIHGSEIRLVMPLRIAVERFLPSKGQRRTLRTNDSLSCLIGPLEITHEIETLFGLHSKRFRSGAPGRTGDILSRDRATSPTDCLQLSVREPDGRLAAVSFFDEGSDAISSIYGIFDPESPRRSLGIFTLLKELEYARAGGKQFFYPGYAYRGASFYDYKKRFAATEYFDWKGSWRPLTEDVL